MEDEFGKRNVDIMDIELPNKRLKTEAEEPGREVTPRIDLTREDSESSSSEEPSKEPLQEATIKQSRKDLSEPSDELDPLWSLEHQKDYFLWFLESGYADE